MHVHIAGRRISKSDSPYMVAELSANHLGDIARAMKIMDAAAAAGADAVKLQTYTADTLTLNTRIEGFVIEEGPWAGRSLHELYAEAFTPWEWHRELFQYGRDLGLTVFSSPFDPTALEFLETLACPAYKIASFELVDIPLVELVASTGKPVIMSTGIADQLEIEEAVSAARNHGCEELILMHCVSAYPTPVEQSHLLKISALAEKFRCPVGLSDHTAGTVVASGAVALGASIIEKHLTLDRVEGGPDAAFSLEPAEFTRLCADCRQVHSACGSVNGQSPDVAASRIFRRSLYIVRDVAAGDSLDEDNVRSIRPGWGMAPKHWHELKGRVFKRALLAGTPLQWDMLEE